MEPKLATTVPPAKGQPACQEQLVPVCGEGRREMSLAKRKSHFRKCHHPQCVAKLAFYEQIAKYVEENLDNPNVK